MSARLLLLAVPLSIGCGRVSAAQESWLAVTRDDLVLEVDVTGALRATRASAIGTPALADESDFKIVRMAPEGTEVGKGDPVLVFDSSDLRRQLADRRSERDAAAQEIVKKKIDLDLGKREGEMRLAEATATQRKAQLKAELPARYTAAVEMKLARVDLDAAEAEVRAAKERVSYQLNLGEAEVSFLRDRHARWDNRVQRLEDAIRQLTVRSPVDGLVVHKTSWRGDKKKVGDSCWSGEGCIEVVDVSEMLGKGEVDETESAQVREGQTVSFRLEALPEVQWRATIERLRTNVYRQSPRNPLKVIGVDLKLEQTDRSRMRPGMMFRGRIEIGRAARTLLVPLEAVFVRAEGPVAFRRTTVGHELVFVRLGRRNGRWAEVLAGLSDGDEVARRDLEKESAR